MAQKLGRQTEWPRVKREPEAFFQTPDGVLKSGRSLDGPLRLGTAPGVGPSGAPANGNGSDFGVDRVSPRDFDPLGTTRQRSGTIPSDLIASQRRR
jgi:hypothetical protein